MKAKKMKKLRKISQLRNLLLVAMADGTLSQSELQFLTAKAIQYKIKPHLLDRIIKRPDKVKILFPKAIGEKIELLYDLVEMVIIDGMIAPSEIAVCKSIATKMEVIPESIDQIIKDVERQLRKAA